MITYQSSFFIYKINVHIAKSLQKYLFGPVLVKWY